MIPRPYIVVIGGPNGAGKTTIARAVLAETLGVLEFVNADAIAAGLAAFNPNAAAIAAGRVMLTRLRELAAAKQTFAFESTLASSNLSHWLEKQVAAGYDLHVVYVALRSPDLAIRRVRERVRAGGHDIPRATITRRFARSARNVMTLYLPIATTWRIYDNSGSAPRLVATGGRDLETSIADPRVWKRLHETATQASQDQSTGDADDADGARD